MATGAAAAVAVLCAWTESARRVRLYDAWWFGRWRQVSREQAQPPADAVSRARAWRQAGMVAAQHAVVHDAMRTWPACKTGERIAWRRSQDKGLCLVL